MDIGPLLVVYLIGAAVLYLALRIFAQARGHAGLAAATYLAMFSAGGLLAGGLFVAYVTQPLPPLRPVWAFAGILFLVSLLKWGLGFLLVRKRIPRAGGAIAGAVLLMSAFACAVCAHPLRMAEQKLAFFRQVDELQRLAPAVRAQWEQNKIRGLPAPGSMPAGTDLRTDLLPKADLVFLPDYLVRQGFSEPIRPQDVKDHHPLLWTARSAMPRHGIAVLANGSVQVFTDDERNAVLARTVDELAAARNSPQGK